DVDDNAVKGIALTGAAFGTGTLWYSSDGGATWQHITSALSDSNALLLAADANTRVYMQPPQDANGTDAALNFRAWDQTSGAAGTYVDTSTNGGTSAFSTDFESATMFLTPVNDAPTVVGGTTTLAAISEDNTNPPGDTVQNL